jgi:hypothetical protein
VTLAAAAQSEENARIMRRGRLYRMSDSPRFRLRPPARVVLPLTAVVLVVGLAGAGRSPAPTRRRPRARPSRARR